MRVLGWAGFAVLLCLVFLPGCGSGQVEVEGTVTYDGQPLKAGTIAFMPADGKGRKGGGTILDGKYHVLVNEGLKAGSYLVEIRWAKPTGKKFKSETGEVLEVTEEGLPAKYNDKSELKAELKPGKNPVNFDLPK
jgi:hypothetical protein